MNRDPMVIDEDDLPAQRPQVGRPTPAPLVAPPSARPTPVEDPLDTAIRPDDAPAGEDRAAHIPERIDDISFAIHAQAPGPTHIDRFDGHPRRLRLRAVHRPRAIDAQLLAIR